MDEPLVSICCITFNHAPYIRQCLDGFLMQKVNFKYEIIIHDDCSTDGTKEIIEEYVSKYPDIFVPLYEEENQYSKGVRGMFVKFVFPKARGKYIAMCEGDDYWIDENKLQMQVDCLESNKDVKMCFSNSYISSNNTLENVLTPNVKDNGIIKTGNIIRYGGMFVPTPSMVFDKKILEVYPDYCRNCWVGDFPLQIRCALSGKVYCFNTPLAVYNKGVIGSWTQTHKLESFKKKKLGIESELIMLNNFNSCSKYIYNRYFMLRKSALLSRFVLQEWKLFVEGPWYNFVFLFCSLHICIKKFLMKKLGLKLHEKYNIA